MESALSIRLCSVKFNHWEITGRTPEFNDVLNCDEENENYEELTEVQKHDEMIEYIADRMELDKYYISEQLDLFYNQAIEIKE